MKFRNTAVIFSFVLLFSIFNMGFVPAPSHPVNTYECGEGEFYDFVDGSCRANDEIGEIEPPGFFGGIIDRVKFAFSDTETKAELSAVFTAQQIARLEQALAEGDYKKAELISGDIQQTLESSEKYIEEFSDENVDYDEFYRGDGEFNDFLYTKRMYVQDIEKLNEIKGEILKSVKAGETTHAEVDGIFDNINNEGEVIAKLEEKENEFVDKTAEDGGVTKLEVKYAIENEDKETGITEHYYQNVDSVDYAETMTKLDSLRTQIADSDKPYSREVESLFDEARLRAQLSQSEIQNQHYSDGYNEFYKSQYIMYNLENYAEEGERALTQIDDSVAVGPVELNKEIVEKNNQMIRDYELARNMLLEKYPEEVKNLDSSYIEAQDVVALSEKIDEVADEELVKLEEAGKTEEEAKEIIEDKKVEEYYYNYGGKYFPPQYVHVSTDDETKEINYDYGGGFVKRYDYSDEAGDTDYRFGDNGYTWKTWTGEEYPAPYPSDYEPERVRRGDEVFRTEVETDDGNYNYEYYATGYKTIAPDGTETEKIYSDVADKMQFTGGAFVDYEPTGYVVTYKGDSQVWHGNPAFDNYINLADGKVFVPEVSPQEDATYKTEEKVYEDSYEGVKWTFDPATKVWTNEITQQAVPTTAPDAPIGYEEKAELKTEDGTEWKYDETKNSWDWTTADGIEGEYIPAPNNYYSYDDETGNYIDVKGNYVGAVEYGGEKWTMQGGTWISEGKTTYNPKKAETWVLVGDAYVLASELESIDSRNYNYGRMYGADGKEVRSYTYNTGSYAWDPRTNSYGYYSEYGLANYDPANPTKHELKDAEGNVITTWAQDRDGRWRVDGSVGENGYFGYEKYSAYPTGTPATGGYPGYYGGYYDSATGSYVGATGCSGGCRGDFGFGTNYYGGTYSNNLGNIQQLDGTWRPATSQAEVDVAKTAGTYIPSIGDPMGFKSGNYYTGGSTPSTPTGTSYQYSDPNSGKISTYTKTATGDWLGSDGVKVGTPPGYSTGSYPGGYDATTGTSGYYSNGAWVSTPSTNYGGSYASYYGGYSGTGASVGTTAVYNGQTYTVTSEKGWIDASGNPVSPPPGYSSSATGSYSTGYSGGYYSGTDGTWVSSGGYTGGGGYDASGKYVGGSYGSYDSTGNYVPSGSYVGTYATGPTGYFNEAGTWVAPSSGSYTGTYAYPGGYDPAAAAAGWPGGAYPGGVAPYGGAYTGPVGTTTDSTGSTWTQSSDGSWTSSSGSTAPSGGTTTTSTSTGTYSGGDTSTSSTSTSTSSGGDSGGSAPSGGESAPTGGVISDSDNVQSGNWFRNFWKSLFN